MPTHEKPINYFALRNFHVSSLNHFFLFRKSESGHPCWVHILCDNKYKQGLICYNYTILFMVYSGVQSKNNEYHIVNKVENQSIYE